MVQRVKERERVEWGKDEECLNATNVCPAAQLFSFLIVYTENYTRFYVQRKTDEKHDKRQCGAPHEDGLPKVGTWPPAVEADGGEKPL